MCVYKSGGDLELGWWCYALHLLVWDFEKDSKERETEVQGEGLGGDGVNE
jgi:hypothetical protein